MKKKYGIIIATKNEKEGIVKVLCSIPKDVKRNSEIIVVDSSDDCTPELAKKCGARVVKEYRKGKGRAMKTGVERSKGDILIFLDGDGTDPPQFIPGLLKKLERADMVLGCRSFRNFKEDDTFMRIVFKIYAPLVVILFSMIGFNVCGDPLAGFRAIRRKDWKRLDIKSDDFTIETEINIKAVKLKLKIERVSIPNLKRCGGLGKSKFLSSPRMWLKMVNFVLRYAICGRV